MIMTLLMNGFAIYIRYKFRKENKMVKELKAIKDLISTMAVSKPEGD